MVVLQLNIIKMNSIKKSLVGLAFGSSVLIGSGCGDINWDADMGPVLLGVTGMATQAQGIEEGNPSKIVVGDSMVDIAASYAGRSKFNFNINPNSAPIRNRVQGREQVSDSSGFNLVPSVDFDGNGTIDLGRGDYINFDGENVFYRNTNIAIFMRGDLYGGGRFLEIEILNSDGLRVSYSEGFLPHISGSSSKNAVSSWTKFHGFSTSV